MEKSAKTSQQGKTRSELPHRGTWWSPGRRHGVGKRGYALRKWVRQVERNTGTRPGLTTEERERLKQLERENFELRRANEILRLASAYFAKAELDRRHK